MITGRCHCGRIAFEIDGSIPEQLTRCTCSFCSKRGMLYAYYPPERFRLMTPPEHEATYRWGSREVVHRFCPLCGCGVYFDSPVWEDGRKQGRRHIGVNARLFDDFQATAWPQTVIDGKNLW
jgi:hypothetical protein